MVFEAVEKGLDAVVCYPTAVIGPHDFRGSESGKMIIDLTNNKIPAYVHGAYDFVDVRDVVDGMIRIMNTAKKGEDYILGGEKLTIKEFFELMTKADQRIKLPSIVIPVPLAKFVARCTEFVSRLFGIEPFFTEFAIRVLQSKHIISSQKARKDLNYNPRPIFESIEDSLEWHKEQGNIKL